MVFVIAIVPKGNMPKQPISAWRWWLLAHSPKRWNGCSDIQIGKVNHPERE